MAKKKTISKTDNRLRLKQLTQDEDDKKAEEERKKKVQEIIANARGNETQESIAKIRKENKQTEKKYNINSRPTANINDNYDTRPYEEVDGVKYYINNNSSDTAPTIKESSLEKDKSESTWASRVNSFLDHPLLSIGSLFNKDTHYANRYEKAAEYYEKGKYNDAEDEISGLLINYYGFGLETGEGGQYNNINAQQSREKLDNLISKNNAKLNAINDAISDGNLSNEDLSKLQQLRDKYDDKNKILTLAKNIADKRQEEFDNSEYSKNIKIQERAADIINDTDTNASEKARAIVAYLGAGTKNNADTAYDSMNQILDIDSNTMKFLARIPEDILTGNFFQMGSAGGDLIKDTEMIWSGLKGDKTVSTDTKLTGGQIAWTAADALVKGYDVVTAANIGNPSAYSPYINKTPKEIVKQYLVGNMKNKGILLEGLEEGVEEYVETFTEYGREGYIKNTQDLKQANREAIKAAATGFAIGAGVSGLSNAPTFIASNAWSRKGTSMIVGNMEDIAKYSGSNDATREILDAKNITEALSQGKVVMIPNTISDVTTKDVAANSQPMYIFASKKELDTFKKRKLAEIDKQYNKYFDNGKINKKYELEYNAKRNEVKNAANNWLVANPNDWNFSTQVNSILNNNKINMLRVDNQKEVTNTIETKNNVDGIAVKRLDKKLNNMLMLDESVDKKINDNYKIQKNIDAFKNGNINDVVNDYTGQILHAYEKGKMSKDNVYNALETTVTDLSKATRDPIGSRTKLRDANGEVVYVRKSDYGSGNRYTIVQDDALHETYIYTNGKVLKSNLETDADINDVSLHNLQRLKQDNLITDKEGHIHNKMSQADVCAIIKENPEADKLILFTTGYDGAILENENNLEYVAAFNDMDAYGEFNVKEKINKIIESNTAKTYEGKGSLYADNKNSQIWTFNEEYELTLLNNNAKETARNISKLGLARTQANETAIDYYIDISNALDIPIKFLSKVDAVTTGKTDENGITIYINTDTNTLQSGTVMHEIYHVVSQREGKKHKAKFSAFNATLDDDIVRSGLDTQISKIVGYDYDTAKSDPVKLNEWRAYGFQTLCNNQIFVRALMKSNPSLKPVFQDYITKLSNANGTILNKKRTTELVDLFTDVTYGKATSPKKRLTTEANSVELEERVILSKPTKEVKTSQQIKEEIKVKQDAIKQENIQKAADIVKTKTKDTKDKVKARQAELATKVQELNERNQKLYDDAKKRVEAETKKAELNAKNQKIYDEAKVRAEAEVAAKIEAERIAAEKAEADRVAKLSPKEKLQDELAKIKRDMFDLDMIDNWSTQTKQRYTELEQKAAELNNKLNDIITEETVTEVNTEPEIKITKEEVKQEVTAETKVDIAKTKARYTDALVNSKAKDITGKLIKLYGDTDSRSDNMMTLSSNKYDNSTIMGYANVKNPKKVYDITKLFDAKQTALNEGYDSVILQDSTETRVVMLNPDSQFINADDLTNAEIEFKQIKNNLGRNVIGDENLFQNPDMSKSYINIYGDTVSSVGKHVKAQDVTYAVPKQSFMDMLKGVTKDITLQQFVAGDEAEFIEVVVNDSTGIRNINKKSIVVDPRSLSIANTDQNSVIITTDIGAQVEFADSIRNADSSLELTKKAKINNVPTNTDIPLNEKVYIDLELVTAKEAEALLKMETKNEPTTKRTLWNKIMYEARRATVNKHIYAETTAKQYGDYEMQHLLYAYDHASQSAYNNTFGHVTDYNGRAENVEGIHTIWNMFGIKDEGVNFDVNSDPKKSKQYMQWSKYRMLMYDLDRRESGVKEDQYLFPEYASKKALKDEINKLKNEIGAKKAERADKILDGFRKHQNKYAVDAGYISEDTRASLDSKGYDHFVPLTKHKEGGLLDADFAFVAQPLHKITKTEANVFKNSKGEFDYDVVLAYMQREESVRRNVAKNDILKHASTNTQYRGDGKGGESIYIKGKRINIQGNIDSRIAEGFNMNKAEQLLLGVAYDSKIGQAFTKFNRVSRTLTTEINPAFIIKNSINDLEASCMYTKYNTIDYIRNYNRAKTMLFQDAAELDVLYTEGLLDYKDSKTVVGRAQQIEQLPKIAEYLCAREAGKTHEQAIVECRDVNLDGRRSGWLVGALSGKYVNYLNMSFQALDKKVENIKSIGANLEAGNYSAAAKTILKYGTTIAPAALNALLYRDDKEYAALPSGTKTNYFCVKVGKHDWLTIPKSRETLVSNFITSYITGAYDNISTDKIKELLQYAVSGTFPDQMVAVSFSDDGSDQLLKSLTPGLLKLLLELKSNKSYYSGKAIVKEDESILDNCYNVVNHIATGYLGVAGNALKIGKQILSGNPSWSGVLHYMTGSSYDSTSSREYYDNQEYSNVAYKYSGVKADTLKGKNNIKNRIEYGYIQYKNKNVGQYNTAIEKLEEYQKDSGKDVSGEIETLKKLKKKEQHSLLENNNMYTMYYDYNRGLYIINFEDAQFELDIENNKMTQVKDQIKIGGSAWKKAHKNWHE